MTAWELALPLVVPWIGDAAEGGRTAFLHRAGHRLMVSRGNDWWWREMTSSPRTDPRFRVCVVGFRRRERETRRERERAAEGEGGRSKRIDREDTRRPTERDRVRGSSALHAECATQSLHGTRACPLLI